MSNAPWSISKANVAHECTYRFHLRYSKKVAGHKVENSAGRIGSAVHEIIERMLKGAEFKTAFMASAATKLTRPELLELKTYETGIKRFLTIFAEWRTKQGRPEVYPELKLAISDDHLPSEYWGKDTYFRGIMDIIAIVTRENGKVAVIIDHKSGEISDIEKYMPQLDAYVAIAALVYPEIVGAQAAIHWVKAQAALEEKPVVWGPMYTRAQIEATVIPKFLKHLEEADALTQARPTPTEGWYCDFCEYSSTCPIK